MEKKGLLLTAAATLTPYDVGGWHKQKKVHDWNESTKDMAKHSKSGEAKKIKKGRWEIGHATIYFCVVNN